MVQKVSQFYLTVVYCEQWCEKLRSWFDYNILGSPIILLTLHITHSNGSLIKLPNFCTSVTKYCSPIRLPSFAHHHSQYKVVCQNCQTFHFTKGPFILRCNCVALPHYTLLHRNCDVTPLQYRMKVKFILTWNAVMLRWLAAKSNRYIGTATQLRCSMNGP